MKNKQVHIPDWMVKKIKSEPYVKTVQEVVNDYLAYTKDDKDLWQWPWETLQRGRGDCEDYTILIIWLAKLLHMKLDMIILKHKAKPDTYHAAVLLIKNKTIQRTQNCWVRMERTLIVDSTSKNTFSLEDKECQWEKVRIIPHWRVVFEIIWNRAWAYLRGERFTG